MPEFIVGDRVCVNAPGSKSHRKMGIVSNIVDTFGYVNSSNITVVLDDSHYTIDVNCFSGIGIDLVVYNNADHNC